MFYKLIIKLTNRSILLLIRFSIQDRGIDPGIFAGHLLWRRFAVSEWF